METFGLGGRGRCRHDPQIRDKRLAGIEAQLAVSDQPDPLPEFREGRPAADGVGRSWACPARRAVVQTLIGSIVINRAGRRGQRFDPETVEVTWHDQVLEHLDA